MKDYLYGLFGALICGFMMKGNVFTYILGLAVACVGLWYILKKSPQKTMFYGILTGVVLILLLPADFKWL